ncbi:phosphate ABC transporter substrate-binding/OmpA family protein [Zooshikella marina]|uniref:substrate-binding domain-containing protein n=1 Tax=Zooshikella ganghwensis TaxID=202772 RepID=UPI001BB0A3F3|nr:phosphate ABC transporter substrate-binding/OmpA family protein [Zooshikella ganghwensis]MBU2704548.1 phosphate ABC transporter substrate-binding/OmpA family protein [Zooshikella ganghwensis]
MFSYLQRTGFMPLMIRGIMAGICCFAITAKGLEPFTRLNGSGADTNLFNMAGSNTIGAELGPELVKAYLQAKQAQQIKIEETGINELKVTGSVPALKKTVSVNISAHGSSDGFRQLAAGNVQIGAASRPVKGSEVSKLGGDTIRNVDHEFILALDGIAVIVNKNNPLKQLQVKQVADVFSGRISEWTQLGWGVDPVKLLARDAQSGTWDTFNSLVLNGRGALAVSAERLESNEELSRKVANDPNFIGFVSLNAIGRAKALAIADGGNHYIKPSAASVATEDYPLSRRLYMYSLSDDDFVKEFLAFTQSPEGQAVVEKTGFISQKVDRLPQTNLSTMPKDYRDMVKGYQRLSVNFRFVAGKADLDNKAIRDLNRLVDFYAQQGGNKKLLLIGFADADVKGAKRALLAKLRAKVVSRELTKGGVSHGAVEAKGYGVLELASGESLAGKTKNRRVEVWIEK